MRTERTQSVERMWAPNLNPDISHPRTCDIAYPQELSGSLGFDYENVEYPQETFSRVKPFIDEFEPQPTLNSKLRASCYGLGLRGCLRPEPLAEIT